MVEPELVENHRLQPQLSAGTRRPTHFRSGSSHALWCAACRRGTTGSTSCSWSADAQGYHTVVMLRGHTMIFLWFLAGTQRTQSAWEDPDLKWVGHRVPALRELGL